MEKKQRTEPSIVDDVDRVSSWLRHATHKQYEGGVSELGDSTIIEPATPPGRPHLPTFYAEASPTDTTFSGCSIFDAPDSPGCGWIEDVFGDDIPDATAGDDQKVCFAEKKKTPAATLVGLGLDPSETDSHPSYESPSEAAETLEELLKLKDEDHETRQKKLQLADESGLFIAGGGVAGQGDEVPAWDHHTAVEPIIASYLNGFLPTFFGYDNWGAERQAPELQQPVYPGRAKALWTGVDSMTWDAYPIVGAMTTSTTGREAKSGAE
ncbi:hypothetical protein E8E11_002240 [Didymella keratinophila]|nr:hypothetical protein E8E11_002240 [Didymella keratinophila]